MKKLTKLISIVLAIIMCLTLCTQAVFAFEQNPSVLDTAGGTAETPVVLNVTPANFSVTVPTGLPITVTADGQIETADSAKIINNSAGSVKVANVAVEGQNDWTIVDFGTDPDSFKVDEKKVGLQINSANEKTADDQSFAFDASKWSVMTATDGQDGGDDECVFTYDAILAPQSAAITDAVIANVVFTVDWDKVEEPIYYNQPYNLTDGTDTETVVFYESGIGEWFWNGKFDGGFDFTIEGNSIVLDGNNYPFEISSDKTQLTRNGDTYVLNVDKHDIYFGEPYTIVLDNGAFGSWVFNDDGSDVGYLDGEVYWSNPAGTYSYGNNTIVNLENGSTGYVSFDGTQIIYPEYGIYELSEKISFTIDGTEYEAIEGMTWYTWVNSEYNTGDYTCLGITSSVSNDPLSVVLNEDEQRGDDVIIGGASYTMELTK